MRHVRHFKPVQALAVGLFLIPLGWSPVDAGFDEDGNLDAVFAIGFAFSEPQPQRVCLGDGTGGFECDDFSGESVTPGVAVGDMNNDGHLDAVFAPDKVCLGDGTGDFDCGLDGTTFFGDVALGYVDGDDNLDAVFVVHAAFRVNPVCLGNGTGNFDCSELITNGNVSQHGVALGDVDNDSNLDAVLAGFGSPDVVCLGDGSGNFDCSDASTPLDASAGVALGYIDSDGNLDAVIASSGPIPNQVCLGDGSGASNATM